MPKNIQVRVDLIDSSGNVIRNLYEDVSPASLNVPQELLIDVDTSDLAPGYYGLRATFINTVTQNEITSKDFPNALFIRLTTAGPELPDSTMIGIPVITAPGTLNIGDTWSGEISVPILALQPYSVGRRVYLKKGDEGAIVSPNQILTIEPNSIMTVPLDFDTSGLEEGKYDVILEMWDINGDTFLQADIGDLVMAPAPVVEPEYPDVPDETMVGTPTLTAPDEIPIGSTWSGVIAVPSMVPISYSIGRQVYLEKDGAQTTVVPGSSLLINPDSALSIPLNLNTSGMEEGRYDVILQMWDINGDTFLQADIGDLDVYTPEEAPELPEFPTYPDASMFGTPTISLLPDELEIGSSYSGELTLPSLAPTNYTISRRIAFGEPGAYSIVAAGQNVTLTPFAPLTIPFTIDTSGFEAGDYSLLLEVWDAASTRILAVDLPITLVTPPPPGAEVFGVPILNAPLKQAIGSNWTGSVTIPTLPVSTQTLFFKSRVFLEGSTYDVNTVQGNTALGNNINVPLNFPTTGMDPGTYGIVLQVSDAFNNLIASFSLGDLLLGFSLPSAPTFSIPAPTLNLPTQMEFTESTDVSTPSNLLPGTMDVTLPSMTELGYLDEANYNLTIITKLKPDWYHEYSEPFPLYTSLPNGNPDKPEITVGLNTNSESLIDLPYTLKYKHPDKCISKCIFKKSYIGGEPVLTDTEVDCDVYVTIKNSNGEVLFDDLVGRIKFFALPSGVAKLGPPSLTFTPSSVEQGTPISGSLSIPNIGNVPISLNGGLLLMGSGGVSKDISLPTLNFSPSATMDQGFSIDTSDLPPGPYNLSLNVTDPITGNELINRYFGDAFSILVPAALRGVNEVSDFWVYYDGAPNIDMGLMAEILRGFRPQPPFPLTKVAGDPVGGMIIFKHRGEGGAYTVGYGPAKGHNTPPRYFNSTKFIDPFGLSDKVNPHMEATYVIAFITGTWPSTALYPKGRYDAWKYIYDPEGNKVWSNWDDDIFDVP